MLLGFAVWVLTRRPNEIIHDSRDFTDALEIWQPVIGRQYRTPREIKRFLNRVRYIAMRWRKPSHQKTLAERFFDWAQRRKVEPEQGATINEAGIVLMASMEGLGGEKTPRTNNSNPDVTQALNDHIFKFKSLGEDWQRYREITGELNVN